MVHDHLPYVCSLKELNAVSIYKFSKTALWLGMTCCRHQQHLSDKPIKELGRMSNLQEAGKLQKEFAADLIPHLIQARTSAGLRPLCKPDLLQVWNSIYTNQTLTHLEGSWEKNLTKEHVAENTSKETLWSKAFTYSPVTSCGMAWTPVASYFILALQSEQLLVNRRSLQALNLIVAWPLSKPNLCQASVLKGHTKWVYFAS